MTTYFNASPVRGQCAFCHEKGLLDWRVVAEDGSLRFCCHDCSLEHSEEEQPYDDYEAERARESRLERGLSGGQP